MHLQLKVKTSFSPMWQRIISQSNIQKRQHSWMWYGLAQLYFGWPSTWIWPIQARNVSDDAGLFVDILYMKWNPIIYELVWKYRMGKLDRYKTTANHYIDVIMTTMASQITSLTVVYSIVYSGADQRKHQSSPSLAFVRGIHRDRWITRTKGQ